MTCGAPLDLPGGAVLAGRYEVKALLGRGGMGAVYRAHDRVIDEDVALKVLDGPEGSGEPTRRWLTEIRLARQVTHPNVCRIHDCGEDGARRWISMELVDGQTVQDLLRSGPLPPERAWDTAIQAGDGLAAVHRAGVVHRDLKTLNLTVDHSSRVRVMDFGIAAPAASGDTGERGYLMGSPEYISPEQARGRPADARSDVYALGVVIFELFTGRVPFRAETPVETLLLHLEAPPPLDDRRLPEKLRPVLARALAKEPVGRFADAGAFATALRGARGEPDTTTNGAGERAGKRRGTGRRIAIGALGVAALATAILALRTRTHPPPTPGPDRPASTYTPAGANESSPASAEDGGAGGTVRNPARGVPSAPASSAVSVAGAPTPGTSPVGAGSNHRTEVPETSDGTPPDSPARDLPSGGTTNSEPADPANPAGRPGATTPPIGSTAGPPPVAEGALLVLADPWADVSVDGVPVGQTPLAAIPLTAGPHQVLLNHPDYQPYPRRVSIRVGETTRLVVDLTVDAVRRPR